MVAGQLRCGRKRKWKRGERASEQSITMVISPSAAPSDVSLQIGLRSNPSRRASDRSLIAVKTNRDAASCLLCKIRRGLPGPEEPEQCGRYHRRGTWIGSSLAGCNAFRVSSPFGMSSHVSHIDAPSWTDAMQRKMRICRMGYGYRHRLGTCSLFSQSKYPHICL